MSGDACDKDIHHSLLTAIASAAAVSEGRSASAGSAEDVKMPWAVAQEASLIEQKNLVGLVKSSVAPFRSWFDTSPRTDQTCVRNKPC